MSIVFFILASSVDFPSPTCPRSTKELTDEDKILQRFIETLLYSSFLETPHFSFIILSISACGFLSNLCNHRYISAGLSCFMRLSRELLKMSCAHTFEVFKISTRIFTSEYRSGHLHALQSESNSHKFPPYNVFIKRASLVRVLCLSSFKNISSNSRGRGVLLILKVWRYHCRIALSSISLVLRRFARQKVRRAIGEVG